MARVVASSSCARGFGGLRAVAERGASPPVRANAQLRLRARLLRLTAIANPAARAAAPPPAAAWDVGCRRARAGGNTNGACNPNCNYRAFAPPSTASTARASYSRRARRPYPCPHGIGPAGAAPRAGLAARNATAVCTARVGGECPARLLLPEGPVAADRGREVRRPRTRAPAARYAALSMRGAEVYDFATTAVPAVCATCSRTRAWRRATSTSSCSTRRTARASSTPSRASSASRPATRPRARSVNVAGVANDGRGVAAASSRRARRATKAPAPRRARSPLARVVLAGFAGLVGAAAKAGSAPARRLAHVSVSTRRRRSARRCRHAAEALDGTRSESAIARVARGDGASARGGRAQWRPLRRSSHASCSRTPSADV